MTTNKSPIRRILLCDDELHILRAAEFKFKRAGYDVFLVLEATIGFNKRDEENGEASEEGEAETPRTFETTGKIKLTTQDHKFLRALKIAVDEEAR